MRRLLVALLCVVFLAGCGTYRITYRMPSRTPVDGPPIKMGHSHGIGPLLVGGGGYFFLFSQISPALIDYTGTRRISEVCPNGIAQLSHHHTFGQNTAAAFISWLLVVNWRHTSDELWVCAQPEAPPEASTGTPTTLRPAVQQSND
jgi:hypothetical protein